MEIYLHSSTVIEQLIKFKIPCEHDKGFFHNLDQKVINTWFDGIFDRIASAAQITHLPYHRNMIKERDFVQNKEFSYLKQQSVVIQDVRRKLGRPRKGIIN